MARVELENINLVRRSKARGRPRRSLAAPTTATAQLMLPSSATINVHSPTGGQPAGVSGDLVASVQGASPFGLPYKPYPTIDDLLQDITLPYDFAEMLTASVSSAYIPNTLVNGDFWYDGSADIKASDTEGPIPATLTCCSSRAQRCSSWKQG